MNMMSKIVADRELLFRKGDIEKTFAARDAGIALDKEYAHCRFERELLRIERGRLIRSGVIRPLYMMQPQMMVKTDGVWVAEVKRYV